MSPNLTTMNLFAELPPPTATELYTWLCCTCAALGIALLIKSLFWGDKTPQPLIVKEQKQFVTRAEAEKCQAETDRRLSFIEHRIIESDTRLDAHVQRIEAKGEERAAKLHARMDGLAERLVSAVGEIKGEIRRIK